MTKFCCFLLCITAFFRPIQMQTEENCSREEVDKCNNVSGIDIRSLLTKYYVDKRLPSEAFWISNCGKLETYFSCVIEKMDTCGGSNSGIIAEHNAINLICDENSEERKAYARNVDCINGQVENIEKCISDSWSFAKSQFESKEPLSEEENRERFCLSFFADKNVCFLGILTRKCDRQIYAPAKNFLQGMFTHQAEICPEDMAEEVGKKYESEIETWIQNYVQ